MTANPGRGIQFPVESRMPPETTTSPPRRKISIETLTRQRIHDFILVCRPQQWVKNIFVLAPVLFSETPFTRGKLLHSIVATGCFCLFSSSVYIVNDLIDRSSDRLHPRKCGRPIASGRLSVGAAIVLLSTLLSVGMALAVVVLPRSFVICSYLYVFNSVMYCVWLKQKVILDVIVIAIGFVLRLLAGCAAIDVIATSWLVVCGFCLALVLGFGKRRTEVETLANGSEHRLVLLSYNPAKCDTLLAISTAVCLVSYITYTLAPETFAIHRTPNLVYTTPLVAYGLFRYMFKTQEGKGGDGPTEILVSDWVFPATGLLWVTAVLVILAIR
jgi:4-hydroxybenzoate polyprenyltransferase